jgi:hypothetical protein
MHLTTTKRPHTPGTQCNLLQPSQIPWLHLLAPSYIPPTHPQVTYTSCNKEYACQAVPLADWLSVLGQASHAMPQQQ